MTKLIYNSLICNIDWVTIDKKVGYYATQDSNIREQSEQEQNKCPAKNS
jgi:hypothetical protein